jgi:hypothetical protein
VAALGSPQSWSTPITMAGFYAAIALANIQITTRGRYRSHQQP